MTKEPIVISGTSGAWGKGTKRSALGVKIASQGHMTPSLADGCLPEALFSTPLGRVSFSSLLWPDVLRLFLYFCDIQSTVAYVLSDNIIPMLTIQALKLVTRLDH